MYIRSKKAFNLWCVRAELTMTIILTFILDSSADRDAVVQWYLGLCLFVALLILSAFPNQSTTCNTNTVYNIIPRLYHANKLEIMHTTFELQQLKICAVNTCGNFSHRRIGILIRPVIIYPLNMPCWYILYSSTYQMTVECRLL